MRLRECFTVMLLLCLASPAFALQGLPDYVKFPPEVIIGNPTCNGGMACGAQDYGEEAFQISVDPQIANQVVTKKGKYYQSSLKFARGISPREEAAWQKVKPAWVASGWQVVVEYPYCTLKYVRNGREAWAKMVFSGDPSYDPIYLYLVEVGTAKTVIQLVPPATVPERFQDGEDFPYLSHFPGAKLGGTEHLEGPMDLRIPGHSEDPLLVGSGSIMKRYAQPANLSSLEFATVYRNALDKAGWQIIDVSAGSDASVTAHYASHGRDIWTYMHMIAGDISVQVADAGAEDLKQKLEKECHVALYGIHFDFNKATLRPDSEPLLNKIADLLKNNPTLVVELQGHTDNVGGDDYNSKLSQSRAGAVVTWLKAHGITSTRLSAHGYGRSHPVADNVSEEGRAKNRRVELAKVACH